MDSFMNLAKQGYAAYEKSQTDVSKTGGQEYNSPHHSGQGGSGNHGSNRPQFNEDEVVQTAQNHGSGDSSLFSSALGFLSDNRASSATNRLSSQHEEPIDEEEVTRAHEKVYHKGQASDLSAGSMGSAAAMQVLKKFVGGGGSSSGGGSQSQLISMAMAEATQLFDKSGGAASGNKQDAVNGAAMTIMKLLVQSKFSSAIGGGNSGGLSGLMSLASQFAK